MNWENCRLATTMIDGATLGRTCRKSTRAGPLPSAAAACTKSRCFTDSTSPLTTRAYTTQPAAERLMMMFRSPSPTMALMVSARSTKGKESCTSAMRMSTVSGQPAEEAGDEAEQPAHHRGQQHRAEADEERDAGAVEHARVEVAAELVRAEEVAGRARRLEARHEIALDRVVRREQGRGEGGDQGHRRQEEAEDAERVALESPDHAASASRRVRGSSQP